MAKPTKVKYDVSDDEEEYSKEELMDMCEQVHTCFEMKRKECKELRKNSERLMEAHEKLGNAHSKLEKAHSSLIEQCKVEEAKKEQVIISCDVGLICDLIDESIFVAPTNTSCSTTTSTSPLNDVSLVKPH